MLGTGVVLRDPGGRRQPLTAMRELAPGTDRYGAQVAATSEGRWHFQVEAWGDPVAHWQHDAGIKVPIGQDAELMLTEGAVLFERAAAQIRTARGAAADQVLQAKAARAELEELAARLRDEQIPPLERLAAAGTPAVAAVLAAFPLRDLLTRSGYFPLVVDRQRALYSSWYEFFPRSEGARDDPAAEGRLQSGTLRTAAGGWTPSPGWVSTSSTCRPSIRSAARRARAGATR